MPWAPLAPARLVSRFSLNSRSYFERVCVVQCRCGASTRGDFFTTSLGGINRLDPGKRKRAFQKDCARIWGNQYDYSRARYRDNHTPVEIICQRHGSFKLRPRDHIQRRAGCPQCTSRQTPREVGHGPQTATRTTDADVISADTSHQNRLPPLGQHVLRSPDIAKKIAAAAVPDDVAGVSVAEIGAGEGALTRELLARPGCRRVVGFEVDEKMICRLLQPGSLGSVTLHAGRETLLPVPAARDVLDHDGIVQPLPMHASNWARHDWQKVLAEDDRRRCVIFHGDFFSCKSLPSDCQVVVGNIPYRISAGIVLKLLEQRPLLARIVLMVQAEFARRLLARPGEFKYGRLAVLAELCCGARRDLALPGKVLPEAFEPPPRVDSAVVCMEPNLDALQTYGLLDVPLRDVDQLLRALFDDARGPARGMSVQASLEAREQELGLPLCWRAAVAKIGVSHQPAITLQPKDCAALALELHAMRGK